MSKRDLFFTFACALITSVFLFPTLNSTNLYSKLPVPLVLLFLIFPAVSVIGMFIASILGKKVPILWQISKFGQVGVLNTAVDFGILNFLMAAVQVNSGVGIVFINATSFTTALINSYFWNKKWVFVGQNKSNFITFAVVTLIGLSINTGIVYGLTTYVPPILVKSNTLWANLAKLAATGFSLIWNFIGYKLIVFKNNSTPKEAFS